MQSNCDGEGPHAEGVVKRLPMSADPNHGGLILCESCFKREQAFRRERNRSLPISAAYPLKVWHAMPVYEA